MKSRLIALVLALFLFLNLEAQEGIRLTWDYKNLTFKEFVARTENMYNIRFFYKYEWVADLNTGAYQGEILLSELLDNMFQGKSLYYFMDNSGNIIITKDFAIKRARAGMTKDTNFLAPTEYYNENETEQLTGNVVQVIGNPAEKNYPGMAVVSGYIKDRDTKEPVSGATVFVQKLSTGTISNEFGFYSLTLPRGSHLLQFSFIGMKERQVSINLYGSGELNMEMNSVLIPLGEVSVTAQKNMTLQRFEVGLEKINVSSFKLMPTSIGEADIIKSVLLIPGVQSVGEGSAGFNVRGGSADQNLVLLYGAPVYNTSHFFGFFSSVNSDIIKDVTLYKGGIPGKYGGRISSVMDITVKDGNRRKIMGSAGISPITTHLLVEGPIKKDTCTFLIAGRTTYSNWVLKMFDNPALKKSRATFYDINAKITYDLNRNNKFDLSVYLSDDCFRFNSDTIYNYNNNIVALKWMHFFNNRFFSVLTINNSLYNYDISSLRPPTEGFVLSHTVNSTGLKYDLNYFQGRHEISYGLDLTYYNISPNKYLPSGNESLVVPDKIQRERAIESALYFDDKIVLTDYLSMEAGFRFSSFFALGPRSVLIYNSDFSRNLSTIIDTVNYGKSKIIKKYGGPEVRLSLNFRISAKNSLKLNYYRTRQYLHLLSNTTTISPTDTWKLCDYYLKPQIGDQFAFGFYHVLLEKGIESSAEIYYKTIRNMIDFKGGTDLLMNGSVEKDIVNVKGKAYGIELNLKKSEGKLRWSIGYTYSRILIKSLGNFSDETINSGNWFPANFDKPHDLVVTLNYLFSRRFSASANYTWSTGRPITYPISTYYLDDMLLIYYSDRNKYRIPDYQRIDFSCTISGNLKAHRIAHPHWTFSVYNLLSRENVYSIYFKNEDNLIKGYKLSVFGRAIPSLTYSFDF